MEFKIQNSDLPLVNITTTHSPSEQCPTAFIMVKKKKSQRREESVTYTMDDNVILNLNSALGY